MKIVVVGTGYVGLVTGTCFAEMGHYVCCVDKDEEKIRKLTIGEVPFYEPGLPELVKRNLYERRLNFVTDVAEAVPDADLAFIAVGTPSGRNGSANLSGVIDAAIDIGHAMTGPLVVVMKSTVPVGSTENLRTVIDQCTRHSFDVVSNPEFLKEGTAIDDFMRPDRVVVGLSDDGARTMMEELYAPFVRTGSPIHFMNLRSAELSKYASNAMLASRVSFMNEMALLCEKVGADVEQVRRVVGSDSRIGSSFLFSGIGWGGSCFPKDVQALLHLGVENNLKLKMVEATLSVNRRQVELLPDKARKHFGDLSGRSFGIWGLSFKPKTDDVREAPALDIVSQLLWLGASLRAYDPVAMLNAKAVLDSWDLPQEVVMTRNQYDAIQDVDGLFLLTEWSEFRQPDFERLRLLMTQPVLFDGRNIWDPAKCRKAGFVYYGIGR